MTKPISEAQFNAKYDGQCTKHYRDCSGWGYVAIPTDGRPIAKVGWSHDMQSLKRRQQDHSRAGFTVRWTARSNLSREHDFHHAMRAFGQPPYNGYEWYEITMGFIVIVSEFIQPHGMLNKLMQLNIEGSEYDLIQWIRDNPSEHTVGM